MFNEKLLKLLSDRTLPCPEIQVGKSLKYDVDELLAGRFGRLGYAVVDDKYTAEAFGTHVFKALSGGGNCLHVTLPTPVKADMATVQWLRTQTQSADILVAVGSGTVNDLCKYAAAQDGKPYVVFPTAASMNGYLSANASITVEGHKTTLSAQMPAAVYCDLSVITAAPERLNKSGLGDSLARATAQADWLLSHQLLGTTYDATPFELLAPYEQELHENARGIPLADPHTLELLMHTLLLSGLGMTICGGSYPASQGEHMIAHSYEMLAGRPPAPPTLHGEEIGITSLYMAQFQQKRLQGKPAFAFADFDDNALTQRFGAHLCSEFQQQYDQKRKAVRTAGLHEISASKWEACVQQLAAVCLPPATILNVLKQSASPTSPQAIGWNLDYFTYACKSARFTRDRFTFLDL